MAVHDRLNQPETQVGGDMGDGVANLAIGQQHNGRFDKNHGDAETEQNGCGRWQSQRSGKVERQLLGQGGVFTGARSEVEHRQQQRQAQAIEQTRQHKRHQRQRCAAWILASQSQQHAQRAAIHTGHCTGRRHRAPR